METNRGYQSTNKTNQSKHGTEGSYAGLFNLDSNLGVSSAYADVGNHLQFINRDAAEYAAKTFKPLYMKYIFGID